MFPVIGLVVLLVMIFGGFAITGSALAPMAFFLLMWLLGATNEKQCKALADYFSPTLVQMKENSAGSNGMFGGDSMTSKDNYAHAVTPTASAMAIRSR